MWTTCVSGSIILSPLAPLFNLYSASFHNGLDTPEVPASGESQVFSESQRTVQIDDFCTLKNIERRHEKHKCSIAHRPRLLVLGFSTTKRQTHVMDLQKSQRYTIDYH